MAGLSSRFPSHTSQQQHPVNRMKTSNRLNEIQRDFQLATVHKGSQTNCHWHLNIELITSILNNKSSCVSVSLPALMSSIALRASVRERATPSMTSSDNIPLTCAEMHRCNPSGFELRVNCCRVCITSMTLVSCNQPADTNKEHHQRRHLDNWC